MKRVFEITKDLEVDIIFPQIFSANYWGFLYKIKNPDIPCLWYCHDLGSFIYQKDLINGLKNPIKTLLNEAGFSSQVIWDGKGSLGFIYASKGSD